MSINETRFIWSTDSETHIVKSPYDAALTLRLLSAHDGAGRLVGTVTGVVALEGRIRSVFEFLSASTLVDASRSMQGLTVVRPSLFWSGLSTSIRADIVEFLKSDAPPLRWYPGLAAYLHDRINDPVLEPVEVLV
jgi:hypothetical protein